MFNSITVNRQNQNNSPIQKTGIFNLPDNNHGLSGDDGFNFATPQESMPMNDPLKYAEYKIARLCESLMQ